MSHEIFTPAWAEAFREQVNRNADYQRAAASWEDPVALVMHPHPAVPEGRRLLLDLFRGECRAARAVNEAEASTAKFVLAATADDWRTIFVARQDPVLALMQGRVKLLKGGMFTLARSASAAKQLVLSATRVPTSFPGDAPPPPAPAAARPAPSPAAGGKREGLLSLGPRGLDHHGLPMKLYHRAKREGTWDPRAIDLARDREDWKRLAHDERDVILRLTALFQGGEESVTQDILPLILAVAREGRLEEEMYLTTFLFEEAKHLEFFRRWVDEVVGAEEAGDLARYQTPAWEAIFLRELPQAMNALLTDSSPAALLRASATYNLVVEGTLAETGYHGYQTMLEAQNLMPGLREGIGLLQRDESRHIAYGVHLLGRLIAAEPGLYDVLEQRMGELLELALGVVRAQFEPYGDHMPFGLNEEEFLAYAMSQFQGRMTRLEKARRGVAGEAAAAESPVR